MWGLTCPEVDGQTGKPFDDPPGDYGTAFELHHGAPIERRYSIDDVDRDLFLATLEIAKLRLLKRIARALETTAGIEHEEPEDHLDIQPHRQT